ncbi:MAG: STAS domain-containing protein [Lentisphaeria bacterium]|nr:STAS domain-containing protein [Lentisphaeria bacterium]MBR2626346.1 STAS domain-containing protein [Lentisphaeria bacterium]
MKAVFDKNANSLTVSVEGSIDTVTAPELDSQLQANWEGITELIMDLAAVDYISSAGLRVILMANQQMEDCDGSMTVRNVNDDIKEIFEMTGFDSLLNLE